MVPEKSIWVHIIRHKYGTVGRLRKQGFGRLSNPLLCLRQMTILTYF